jgi:hypothetical protein
MPAIAGIVMYRAMARETGSPASSVVAAGAYVLSALMLWAFSEGRLSLLVALAVLPFAWDRIDAAFRRRTPERPYRSAVGFGVALAIGGSFALSIALPIGAFAIVNLVAGRRRGRGTVLVALGIGAAVLLAFPVALAAAGDPAAALTSDIGTSDVWSLLRLAPGDGPGTWVVAAFLPIAAIVCFAGAADPQRGRAWRALLVAVAGTVLAWASVAGYLPAALTNAPAWLAAAAVVESALIAYGLSTFARGLGRQAFGFRQLGVAVLSVVLTVGVLAQALQVTFADWAVRPGGLPPAWPVIASSAPGPFRILWLGGPNGEPFPAPGGDPIGLAQAGDATVRFGLTDRDGVSALDEGRARSGPGYDHLHEIVLDLVAGGTRHAGALLGTYGVRFVVSAEGDLPGVARERLLEQLDLDRVPAGGLTIFRNAATLPTAFVSANAAVPDRFAPAEIQSSPAVAGTELDGGGERFSGTAAEPGHVVVTQQFDGGWNVDNGGRALEPFEGYGWAIAAPVQAGDVVVRFTGQWLRAVEMALLGLLWAAALWITRKPGSA